MPYTIGNLIYFRFQKTKIIAFADGQCFTRRQEGITRDFVYSSSMMITINTMKALKANETRIEIVGKAVAVCDIGACIISFHSFPFIMIITITAHAAVAVCIHEVRVGP